MDILMDADNNASTGTSMGPDAGNEVGVDFTVSAGRRQPVASPSRWASLLYVGAHISCADYRNANGGPTGTLSDPMFTDPDGLADTTVTTGVFAFESRMPLDLSPYGGPNLAASDTVSFVVASTRSGETFIGDWLDNKVTYTIADDSLQCGELGYPQGDINKDCYVNLQDLSIFISEWLQ
jgi:hypothetical protein